jgi:tetratricopeptide (TPR) repeat protein
MNENARNVLSDYVAAKTPGEANQAAAWDAINERLAGGDMGPTLPEEPVAASGSSDLLIKGFIVGVVAAAALYGVSQMGDEPTEPAVAEVAPVLEEEPEVEASAGLAIEVEGQTQAKSESATAVEPAEAPESAEAEAGAEQQKPRKKKAAAAPAAAAEQETSAGSTLAAEMALLSKGQRALKRGDAKGALKFFDQHAREYPRGELADERRVQRAQALCDAGRKDEARREADKFAKQRPNSPLLGRASRICQESDG